MSHRRVGAALLAACALIPLAVPAPAPAQKKTKRDVKVMVRNLYLGADIIPLATEQTQDGFERAAAERFQIVLNNDFATRAKGIAAEIARHKPDLVGLQEAARWLRGPDGLKDGRTTPANTEVYDSTDSVLRELAARGQRYRVVRARDWFDFEGPTALGFDVRLVQRDVIIARRGSKVKLGRSFSGGFETHFDVPTVPGLAQSLRGWVGVDGKVGGRSFRFVTTHLEAYSPDIADKQMQELLSGPLASKKRTSILMGDFNSAPTGNANDRGTVRDDNAYYRAIAAGFRNPLPKRATCCFAEDLRQTTKPLDTWIDHIVVRPRARVVRSAIVGSRPSERVNGSIWPSDHAGIYAQLRLR